MNDKPSLSHDLAPVSSPGHALHVREQGATVALTAPRPTARQPRFPITSAKLREAFLHRWKLALAVGLILAGIGAGLAVVTYAPKYTATAILRVVSRGTRVLPRGATFDADYFREEEFRKTQAALIKSRYVLDKVLAMPAIRGLNTLRNVESPDIWLEKELKVVSPPGTDVFYIKMSGQNPAEVAKIVNEVKDQYVKQFMTTEDSKEKNKLGAINNALQTEEDKIKEKRKALLDESNISGMADATTATHKQRWLLEEYGVLNKLLIEIETSILQLKSAQLVHKGITDQPDVEDALIDDYLENSPKLATNLAEIEKLQKKILNYRTTVQPNNRLLVKAYEDLAAARKQLDKAKAELKPELRKRVEAKLDQKRIEQLKDIDRRLKVMEAQKAELKDRVNKLYEKVDSSSRGLAHIELLKAELTEAQEVARSLRSERERLYLELNHALGEEWRGFVPLNLAAIVPTVNEASLLKSGGIFSFVGLLLGVVGVSYFEARSRRLHAPTDVYQELGIKTLGTLPLLTQIDGRPYGRDITIKDSPPGTMFTEAVNGLCASLLCDDRICRGAVLMVTSAGEDEGKTLLATQLAAGLARTGRRTLLLDGDFRNSRCREQLSLPDGPGLSEVLRGEVELSAALQTVPGSEARVLAAGQSDAQVIRSLSNGDFAALLARLRQEFDCVIIDSAPTLVVADGLLMGRLADGVILVVRPKVSKATAVYSAYEQLTNLQIRTLGAVVNGNPCKSTSSYYVRY